MGAGDAIDGLRMRLTAYTVGAHEMLESVRIQVAGKLFGSDARDSDKQLAGSANTFSKATVLITGANQGIGLATAKALYQRGSRVVLACRSLERGREAAAAIEGATPLPGCSTGNLELVELDLGSLASVRKLVKAERARKEPLDILICNAGVMAPPKRIETADGFEQQFQVNYLGHWLLARGLVAEQRRRRQHAWKDRAWAAPGMRVLFLSSLAHLAGELNWEDLQCRRRYNGFRSYANSKLAAILAAKEFQRRFDRDTECGADTALAVHPGLINTSLARGWLVSTALPLPSAIRPLLAPVVEPLLRAAAPLLLLPPSHAVATMLYAAGAPADEVAGRYVAHGRVRQPSRRALDPTLAARLWEESCRLTDTPLQPEL